MALPVIKTPSYEFALPDSGNIIKFRPLLAGEYKVLLTSIAFNDVVSIALSITDVLQACVLDNTQISDLSFVDVEAFFLHLYMRSSENMINVPLRCTNKLNTDEGEKECGTAFNIQIHVDDIQQTITDKQKVIDLGNGVGIKLKYPKWKEWFLNQDKTDNDDALIIACIDSIFDADRVYIPYVDSTQEELTDFINHLSTGAMEQIEAFIADMPSVTWKRELICPSCGTKSQMELVGLADFLN